MSADLRGACVLGVFAHPDDESFAAGGLLTLAAERGARVVIACATRGEAGQLAQPDDAGDAGALVGHSVGDLRSAELAAACAALGASPPRFFGLPDGALSHPQHQAAGRERVRALVEELGPLAVVTLGEDGAYGHRDHLACTGWVRAAVAELPPRARPRLLLAAFPRGLFAPVRKRLRRRADVPIAAELDGAELGTVRAAVDIALPLARRCRPAPPTSADDAAAVDAAASTLRARKRAAMAAHRSQLPGGDPARFLAPALPAQALERLLREEWYRCADGPALPPGARDPFAGLAAQEAG
ncbi:PIG-L family deacetylase [Haliangium ochraceum]|uniref:LmbE family protein n=1 Tax=Haliangium ochraceum (strain DSM 14365 / JCM 11303 / SMP-2) TaxID=502025 RepID=D0LKY8_HALO1|nr:PIG-L family deacetylase [Haliangium ochraceum]ACY16708.1 LmbE family protein [Haliangium ochraceum DSM 14365]